MLRILVTTVTLLSVACATAKLTSGGARVAVANDPQVVECENLGPVVGTGGGALLGGYVPNDKLVTYAMNDARNKAAALGATHITLSAPQLGGMEGTTTTATVSGVAYRCMPSQPVQP